MTLKTVLAPSLAALLMGAGFAMSHPLRAAEPLDADPSYDTLLSEWTKRDALAPADFGPGPGRGKPHPSVDLTNVASTVPSGPANAAEGGVYGDAIPWFIVPIHMALLPDGRVMSFGTDTSGIRDAWQYYDVWDPSLGTDLSAHTLLPNSTGTDIFCSGVSLIGSTGNVLTAGGDHREINEPRTSIASTTLFDPATNSIRFSGSMNYPRWYGTLLALPDGEFLALGGRQGVEHGKSIPAATPEIYSAASGTWRTLPGATSLDAFFTGSNWFYPRAYVAPNGRVFVAALSGQSYWLDTTGPGSVTPIGAVHEGNDSEPAAMYAPGKVLSLRDRNSAVIFDLTGAIPVEAPTANLSQKRYWANATVMADGQVLINGGSAVSNQLNGVAYQNEIWNRGSGLFTLGASATKPRLYHSTSLLLPDATVVTAGGGSPGPVDNFNAEIFYPPYLYRRDGTGRPANRPVLRAAPTVVAVGEAFAARVALEDQISRVTMVRTGAVTHATFTDQLFIEPKFTQAGDELTIQIPHSINVVIPGYYLLFAFDANGVPSIGKIVLVRAPSS